MIIMIPFICQLKVCKDLEKKLVGVYSIFVLWLVTSDQSGCSIGGE